MGFLLLLVIFCLLHHISNGKQFSKKVMLEFSEKKSYEESYKGKGKVHTRNAVFAYPVPVESADGKVAALRKPITAAAQDCSSPPPQVCEQQCPFSEAQYNALEADLQSSRSLLTIRGHELESCQTKSKISEGAKEEIISGLRNRVASLTADKAKVINEKDEVETEKRMIIRDKDAAVAEVLANCKQSQPPPHSSSFPNEYIYGLMLACGVGCGIAVWAVSGRNDALARLKELEKLPKTNAELQARFDKLTHAHADMKGLLEQTTTAKKAAEKAHEQAAKSIVAKDRELEALKAQSDRLTAQVAELKAAHGTLERASSEAAKAVAREHAAAAAAHASKQSALESAHKQTLKEQAAKSDAEMAALRKKLTAVDASLVKANATVAQHEATLAGRDNDIASFSAQVKELTGGKASAEAAVVRLKDVHTGEMGALQKRIVDLEGDVTKSLKYIADIADLEAQGKVDSAEIVALKKRIAELEGQMKSVAEESELNKCEVAAQKTRLCEAEVEGSKDSDEITLLKMRIAELEAEAANGKRLMEAADVKLIASMSTVSTTAAAAREQEAAMKAAMNALRDEVAAKGDEVARLSRLIGELTERNRAIDEQCAAVRQELDSQRATNTTLTADKSALTRELGLSKNNDQAVEALLADLAVKLADDRVQLSKLEGALASANDRSTSHGQALARKDAEIADLCKAKLVLETGHGEMVDELEKLRKVCAEAQSRHESVEAGLNKQLADAVAAAAAAKTAADKRVAELEAQGKKDTVELVAMTKKHADLTKSSDTAKAIVDKSIATLKDDLKKSVDEVAALKKQLADATGAAATAKTAADKRVAELEAQGKKDTAEIAALKKQLEETNTRLAVLAKEFGAYKTESTKTIADLQAQGKKDTAEIAALKKQLADLQALHRKTSDEFAAMMKKHADLIKSSDEAKAATDRSIAALQEDQKSADEITALQKQLADAVAAAAAAKTVADKRIAELEAHGKKDTDEIVSSSNRITDLEKQVADASAQIKQGNVEYTVLMKDLKACKQQMEKDGDAKEELTRHQLEVIDELMEVAGEYKVYKAQSEQRLVDAATQGQKDTEEIVALKKRIAELEGQVKSITEENELAEKEIAALKKRVAELEAQGKKDAAEVATLKKQSTDLTKAIGDLEGQAKLGNSEFAGLNKQLVELAAAKAAADKRVAENEAQGKKDRDEIAALKKRSVELEAQLKKQADELSALTKKFNELTATKAQADKDIAGLTAQGKKDTAEIAALKKQLADAAAVAAAAKIAADKRIAELEAQGKNDTAEIAALNDRIVEIEGQLKNGNHTFAALDKKHTELAKTAGAADKRIAELEAQGKKDTTAITASKKELADAVAAAAAAKSAADKRIAELEAQVKKDTAEIAALKKQLGDVTAAAAAAKTVADKEIAGLKTQGKKDTDEIAALKKQLADLQALQKKTSDELAAMTKKHADLTKSSDTAKAIADKSIATLKDDLKKSTDEVAALKKQLADATGAAATAKIAADERVAELEAQGQKDAAEIAALKKRIAGLEAAFAQSGADLAAYANLQQRSAADAQRLADLAAQGQNDAVEIGALKQRVGELEGSFKAGNDAYVAQMADLGRAKKEVATLTATLRDAEAATAEVKARMGGLVAAHEEALRVAQAAAATSAGRLAEAEQAGRRGAVAYGVLEDEHRVLLGVCDEAQEKTQRLEREMSVMAAEHAKEREVWEALRRYRAAVVGVEVEVDGVGGQGPGVGGVRTKAMAGKTGAKATAGYPAPSVVVQVGGDTGGEVGGEMVMNDQAKAYIDELKLRMEADASEIAGLRVQIGKLESQLRNITDENELTEAEIVKLKKQLKSIVEENGMTEAEVARLQNELSSTAHLLRNSYLELAEVNAQYDRLTALSSPSGGAAAHQELEKTLQTALKKVADLEAQRTAQAGAYRVLEEERNALLLEMQHISKQLTDVEDQISSDFAENTKEISALRAEVAEGRGVQTRLAAAEDQHQRDVETIADLRATLGRLERLVEGGGGDSAARGLAFPTTHTTPSTPTTRANASTSVSPRSPTGLQFQSPSRRPTFVIPPDSDDT